MRVGYKNEPYQIIVDTPNQLTGLTDVQFTIFNSGGAPVTGSPFNAVEIASSGVYTASWTPTTAGDYIIEVSSISEGISAVSGAVRIEENSNTDIITEIGNIEQLTAEQVWTSASRTLTDKVGFALDSAEYTNIANAVEAAILNDGDGQAIIDAIVQQIGNTNINETVLIETITNQLERESGLMQSIDTKVTNIANVLGSDGVKFRVIN